MTFALGLTGSIGMGKSTTAALFADLGCAVWDADAAVHRLYSKGGAAVSGIAEICPDAVIDDQVSRSFLGDVIRKDPEILRDIEVFVHPLVAQDRQEFLAETMSTIAVLDIPLLFETGADKLMDAMACVWVSDDEQKRRVLARGTMDEAQFNAIRDKQLPISEKRARAQYQIETDTPEHATLQVQQIVADIEAKIQNA